MPGVTEVSGLDDSPTASCEGGTVCAPCGAQGHLGAEGVGAAPDWGLVSALPLGTSHLRFILLLSDPLRPHWGYGQVGGQGVGRENGSDSFLLGHLLVAVDCFVPGSSVTCRITVALSFVLGTRISSPRSSPDKRFSKNSIRAPLPLGRISGCSEAAGHLPGALRWAACPSSVVWRLCCALFCGVDDISAFLSDERRGENVTGPSMHLAWP